VLEVAVGAVEEGEAGHGEDAAEGEEQAELAGLQDDDRQVHHGQPEADHPEAEAKLHKVDAGREMFFLILDTTKKILPSAISASAILTQITFIYA
jgi:hypothetical protein